MKYSNKFKSVFDRSAWADKKLKNFNVLEKNYTRLFNLDFSHEIAFKNSLLGPEDIARQPESNEDNSTEIKIDPSEYKKIYRDLARLTHPDTPYGETEAFKKIRQAYVDGDVATLLSEAVDKGLEPDIKPEDIDNINKNTDRKLRSMKETRQGWQFTWANTSRCLTARKSMWSLLGIRSADFKAFLVGRGVDLREYHEESVKRWEIYNNDE
jgi:hypothetical protein